MRTRFSTLFMACVAAVASDGRVRGVDVRADERLATATRSMADEVSGMTFVEIPAGRFRMGSPGSEPGRNPDEILHDVTITRPFLLARYEATQQEWRDVMGTSPAAFASCGPRCPVESVTYEDVQRFLAALNAKGSAAADGAQLRRYRLPTEAEWEYACRAGTVGPFSTGESLDTAQANFNGTFPYPGSGPGAYRQRPLPVGSFPLNPWGLADMHGNVWEWTADWYGSIRGLDGDSVDPHGPSSGEKRVIRGGSWYFDANSARCALRYTHAPSDKGFSLGFRVAADRR